MAGKKINKDKVGEPAIEYKKSRLRIYSSFEQQENAERLYLASLKPLEVLRQMRQMINLAYGLHGLNKPPSKHTIRIISYDDTAE